MAAISALVVGLKLVAIYTPLREFLDLEPLGVVDVGVIEVAAIAVIVVTTIAS